MIVKNGKLFSAIAICSALASCSNEELFEANTGLTPDVTSRPVIGNVTLKVGNETLSRAIGSDGKMDWSDVTIGAALMDELKKEVGDFTGLDKYELSDKMYTNYPYTRNEDGSWSNDALMVEGNYFFYAQYNKNLQRDGLKHSISPVQYAYNKAEYPNLQMTETAPLVRYQAVEDNQLYIGYHGFVAGNEEKDITLHMANAHANLGINICNEGSQDITIHKIVFSDDNLKLDGYLNAAKSNLGSNEFKYFDEEGKETSIDANSTIAACFNMFDASKATDKADAFNPLDKFYTISTSATASDVEMVYPNVKIAAGGNISANFILPNTDLSEATAAIYTNKGVLKFTLNTGGVENVESVQDVKDAINADSHQAFSARTLGANGYTWGTLTDLNTLSSNSLVLAFDEEADFEVPENLSVSSTNELEYYLTNWYKGKNAKDLAQGKIETVSITISNEEGVAINSAIYNYLKGADNSSVEIVGGKLIIPEGIAEDAIMNVTTDTNGTLVIAEGATQTISNSVNSSFASNVTNNGTLSVVATGSTPSNVTTTISGNFQNWGTLNIDSKVTYNGNDRQTSPTNNCFENDGILNINAEFTANTGIRNNSKLYINAKATVGNIINGLSTDNELKGYLNFNADAEEIITIQNYGTIDINKNLSVGITNKNIQTSTTPAKYENAVVNVNEGALLTMEEGSVNNGTLNINGRVEVSGNNVANTKEGSKNDAEVNIKANASLQVLIGGTFTNNSIVSNAGTIACSGEATFANAAGSKLTIEEGGTTLITSNAGEVICNEIQPTLMFSNTEAIGTVSYVMNEAADLNKLHTLINKLTLNYTADEVDLTSILTLPEQTASAKRVTPSHTRIKTIQYNGGATTMKLAAGTQLTNLNVNASGKIKVMCGKSELLAKNDKSTDIQEGFSVQNLKVQGTTQMEIMAGTELYLQAQVDAGKVTANIDNTAMVVVAGKFTAMSDQVGTNNSYVGQNRVISSGGNASPIKWDAETVAKWFVPAVK